MQEAEQLSTLLYFKASAPATLVMADDGPRHLTSRQADIEEGVDASDLLTLMDLDNEEMLIDAPLPLSPVLHTPVPPTTPTSSTPA